MDDRRVIAATQELLRHFQEPDRLQNLAQSLATVAGLLQRQAELGEQIVRLKDETTRAEAESASRLKECQQQEDAAQRRKTEAEIAGHRDLATLEDTRDQLKAEIAALYKERRDVQDVIQHVRDEHAQSLAVFARERAEATRALEAVRSALARVRETIPT